VSWGRLLLIIVHFSSSEALSPMRRLPEAGSLPENPIRASPEGYPEKYKLEFLLAFPLPWGKNVPSLSFLGLSLLCGFLTALIT